MLMADDRGKVWDGMDCIGDVAEDGDAEDLTIDLDAFWDILDEKDPAENHPENYPAEELQQGLPDFEMATSAGVEFAQPATLSSPYNSEASDSRIGTSDSSNEYFANPSIYDHQTLEPSAQAGSPASCSGSLSDWMLPASSLVPGANSFMNAFSSYGLDSHNQTRYQIPNYVPPFGFAPQDQSLDSIMEKPDLNHVDQFDSNEYTSRMSDRSETAESCSMDIGMPIPWDQSGGYNSESVSNNTSLSNLKRGDIICKSSMKRDISRLGNEPKAMSQLLPLASASMFGNNNGIPIKNENGNNLILKGMGHSSYESAYKKSSANGLRAGKSLRMFPAVIVSDLSKKVSGPVKEEKRQFPLIPKRARRDSISESANRKPNLVLGDHYTDVKATVPLTSLKKLYCKKDEIVGETTQPQSGIPVVSSQTTHSTTTTTIVNSFDVDDDPDDICIIENPNEYSRPPNPCSAIRKPLASSQRLTVSDPLDHVGLGGLKLKANDERLVLRVALQDLSQPKKEASPPDGSMAMPLLRHQRIALYWMVQKETASLHCSGGILADDQGLGKTISTIALILTERSPNSSVSTDNPKQNQRETLNLDEDDGCAPVIGGEAVQESPDESLISQAPSRGRPRAGTLVVCPTSVLRQWADELHKKVSAEAKLSVLVYHGGSRTKDPHELAKYDVVLTTYSIVSMEVPKQPLDDKEEDETGRGDDPRDIPFSNKRKYPSSKKKRKQETANLLYELAAKPLARVGWFRVVLDEAQSIKNHRTQTARACWGLRAKRRWCLSGTPIQNAVDDLYSYFRFLRYDPYATYKSFCSSIKVPITKNPTTGYKKLQAVLRTVMLRRTKGTLLDGEPIINLPPKHVELKKVDFTEEEREFYCLLEADSRAQFAKYAAEGTVKQNYVNILLMLLRLRQACDHPLLVKGYNSSSAWKSSVESAKKLPREKQVGLLSCLEASLAICGVCNDPPEDAVVTSCGHVFCNQCICEHLSCDDNQCPTANCKNRLSASFIFSRAALKCCLSQEPGQDGAADSSGSLENNPWGPPFNSSKIKAALKVLEHISKPKLVTLPKESPDPTTLPNKPLDPFAVVEEAKDEDTDMVESSKTLVKVAGEKAIVFSQWTRMLDLLETGLKSSSIQYRRLDGTMSVLARDRAVNDFKTLPEVTVIIMSLKAASLGLNMVAACHVILLDLWWNPTTEDQAVDRAHRIGQTRPVNVLRLTVKDTVEDRILALQEKKREMVASAFGEDRTGSNQTRLTVEDLKYLFMAS